MIRTVGYMVASFFVSALVSKANPWGGLLFFFVHVRRKMTKAPRGTIEESVGVLDEREEHEIAD